MVQFGCYKDGKPAAFTMSYDDGTSFDRDLIALFDKYGIRGTFHLNSGFFGDGGHVSPEEIGTLYKNHEVSCHTVTHPFLEREPAFTVAEQITNDKKRLEEHCGYVVRGMSYPYGTYNDNVINVAKCCGMEYSRTTVSTMGFAVPKNFMEWHPSCHHRDAMTVYDKFAAMNPNYLAGALIYIWGHSYEFDRNNNWDYAEEMCKKFAGREELWYATNIEIYDYINAQRNLKFSTDMKTVYNPAAISVWVRVDGEAVEIKSGETKKL